MKKRIGDVIYYALFLTSIAVLLVRAYWVSGNKKENIELFGYLGIVLLIIAFGWKLGMKFMVRRKRFNKINEIEKKEQPERIKYVKN